MNVERSLWVGVTVHFAVLFGLYLVVGGDVAGLTLIAVAAAFGGLVGGWTWGTTRRQGGPLAQERADADAGDDVGVVGLYPTASLRPLAVAVGMTAVVVGVPLGSWMTIGGLAIVASQVALLVRDLDR